LAWLRWVLGRDAEGRINPLGLPARLALWVLAGLVCAIAVVASEPWSLLMGLRVPDWRTVLGAAAATVAVLSAWPVLQYMQRTAGGTWIMANAVFRRIIALPLAYRLFLVATAAVTEEIFYRGFAVGIGKVVLALTSLFVVTEDLLACMMAHGAIDTVGLVIAPAVKAHRGRAVGNRG
jgi:hypothetical protein